MADLDRNAANQAPWPLHGWPQSSASTKPIIMDSERARFLCLEDTEVYDGRHHRDKGCMLPLKVITKSAATGLQQASCSSIDDDNKALDMIGSSTCTVINVHQKRRYFNGTGPRQSRMGVAMDLSRWLNIIRRVDLPPTAIELLHDNGGGHAALYMKCDRPNDDCGCNSGQTPSTRPCAYHISLKASDIFGSELFIYARTHFHRGHSVVLLAGFNLHHIERKLVHFLNENDTFNIFHVLNICLSVWTYAIEHMRWQADETLQALEFSTNEKFSVKKRISTTPFQYSSDLLSIPRTRMALASSVKATVVLQNILNFTLAELERYQPFDRDLSSDDPDRPFGPFAQLCDALKFRVSQGGNRLVQLDSLLNRMDMQVSITTMLIAERDAALSLEDSKIMRTITVITVIFLPATFLATFFSTVFFDVSFDSGGTSLQASKWLWLYPVIAVPGTLFLCFQFGFKQWVSVLRANRKLGDR